MARLAGPDMPGHRCRVGKNGLLVGIDRDPAAIRAAKERLRGLPVRLAQANFCDLPEVLEQLAIDKVDGVCSTWACRAINGRPARGFSFSSDGDWIALRTMAGQRAIA